MKQMRIAECKCNSLASYSGKEANGKIEYGKNLMKHRKIYLAVSIGCLLMAAIYYQIESHFLINRNPFFYKETMQSLLREADWVYMGNSERDGKKMLELEFRFELAEKLKKTND